MASTSGILVIVVEPEDIPQRTIRFQCGLLREEETFTGADARYLCRDQLVDFACDLLNTKYPDHPYGDLYNKIILYKHDSANALVPLEEDDTIEDGTVIEIILTINSKQEFNSVICPHILKVCTYKGTTFCDYCGVILFGLLKQGLMCEGCEQNFHKKCAYKVPNNCARLKSHESHAPCLHNNGASVQTTWSGRPLWIDRALLSRPQVPHTFFVHSFKKPTVCHHCKKLIKGVFRNGFKCKDCHINCHKKCSKEVGKNCPGEVPSLRQLDSEEERSLVTRHVIANEYLSDESVHEPKGEVHTSTLGASLREDSPASSSVCSQEQPESLATTSMTQSLTDSSDTFVPASMDPIAEEPGVEDNTSNDGSDHNSAEHLNSDNIKLQRVTGVSMRNTKPVPASVIKEGWMIHYTDKSTLRKKFYWRLDTKCLTMYKSDNTTSYYKEIQLADILAVDPMANPEAYPLTPPHVFEIVTSAQTYFVGMDPSTTAKVPSPSQDNDDDRDAAYGVNLLGDWSGLTPQELENIGVGLNVGILWEEALHSALMPITPQTSMASLADVGVSTRSSSFRSKRNSTQGSLKGSFRGGIRGNSFKSSTKAHGGSRRGSFRVPAPPPRGAPPIAAKSVMESKMDISLFYQIFPEDVLGSGQFGTVYTGKNRQTGKEVAVKIIDKLRFPNKQEAQLRQEVTILQNISHPGIVYLEQMFETPEKIYVVMEKMNGDMLEMILNSPQSKISERLAKYMIYQILVALQYLHKKDIVHCDLKPENVLLTSESGMPQAKLCDFGFARVIGEKSFRKSVVGTPAYLAPEVLKNEGYNKSLDLWSVGVIIYVSVSGTFPFNEDEEIMDQIQNAAFMFPSDPWASVSHESIELITRLLQVSRKSRFTAHQALNHAWLNDATLWEDLCQLEGRLGIRYLTHETEDKFWVNKGAKPHPLAKKEEPEPTPRRTSMPSSSKVPGKRENLAMQISQPPKECTPTADPSSPSDDEERAELLPPTPPIVLPPKDSSFKITVEDPVVVKREEHARRIGYTVSTV